MSCDIGVYGLGVMGTNLALNIASKGFKPVKYNKIICNNRNLRLKDFIYEME